MAARPIILFGITAAAAGQRSVPALATTALATSLLVLFLVLELLLEGFHFINSVVILFMAHDTPTLAVGFKDLAILGIMCGFHCAQRSHSFFLLPSKRETSPSSLSPWSAKRVFLGLPPPLPLPFAPDLTFVMLLY